MKRATVSLITVKSCSAFLRMPLVCIRNYLRLVLRYSILILGTYHLDNIYVRKGVTIRG